MRSDLDSFDLTILAALQQDSSLSTAELAERIGLSQSPCRRRIRRLRHEGCIKREVALIDRKWLGLHAHIFAQVKLSFHGRSNPGEFSAAIQTFPGVMECYVTMGTTDFILRICTESIESYERFFFDKLSWVPGVQEVNSVVALSEIKATTALPLPGSAGHHDR